MENSVSVNNQRRMSSMALFWVCLLTTVGIGLAISYCSGIFGGVTAYASKLPFFIPRGWVIAAPPVLFAHMGIALYLVLDNTVSGYTERMVRGWTWAFWISLFIVTAITPYFIYHGMPIAAYVLSTVGTALAIGTTILCYRASGGAGFLMTVFTIVAVLIMVYLGYWAF